MTPMAMWAAKIPRHEDPKVPFSSDDALKTYHVASLKRGIRKGSTGLSDCRRAKRPVDTLLWSYPDDMLLGSVE